MFDQRMPLDVNDMLHPLRGATEKTTQLIERLGDFPQSDAEILDITAEVKRAHAILRMAIASVQDKQRKENILHAKQSTLRRLAALDKPIVSSVLLSGDAQQAAVAELIISGLMTKTPVEGHDDRFELAITDDGREVAAEFDVVYRAAHEAQKAYRRVDS